MTRTIGIILAAALAACGVSKDKFKKVQSQLDACQSSRSDLETRLAATEKKVKERDDTIERLQQTLEDAETAKGKVEEELAGVLKDRARLKESAEELKTALADARKRKAEAEKRVAEFKGLLTKFKSLIDAGKLKVKIVDGRMVLALPTDVLFASGSAKLSDEGKQAITEIAGVLATIKGRRFQVEGHTDNVPIRSRKYPSNWELAADRAVTVTKTMTEAGMPGASLSAASYGEFRPTAPNDSAENKKANRRIEIVLVPDLSSLPGFDELKSAVGES